MLECRAANVERKVETLRRRFDQPDHFRNELLESGITANQIGFGKTVL